MGICNLATCILCSMQICISSQAGPSTKKQTCNRVAVLVVTVRTSITPCRIPKFFAPSLAHTTPIGEEFDSNYQVHKLPNTDVNTEEADPMIKTALLAHVEMLKAENVRLKGKVQVIVRNTYVLKAFEMTNLYSFTLGLCLLQYLQYFLTFWDLL